MRQQPSANFDARPPGTPIDMLVLHYTGMESRQGAIDRLCSPVAGVSAHYLIDEDGAVTQMVHEDFRAWHAGEACWRGHRDVNARSIGIELVNPGHEYGLCAFPGNQMQALEILALDIASRHRIPARNVVGHSDVAPRRKRDPGELFDWFRLFKAGLGVWPVGTASRQVDRQQAEKRLGAFGYETVDLTRAVEAFQRHFRPATIDGRLDQETATLLDRLSAAVGQ